MPIRSQPASAPLSRAQATYIRQLKHKKHQLKAHAFLIEGRKCVHALLTSTHEVEMVVVTPECLLRDAELLEGCTAPLFTASDTLLSQISALQQNHDILAVARRRPQRAFSIGPAERGLILDGISDPGNLGTIIRIAHWYDIKKILCAPTTVDCYNPKAIQATMGSFTAVSCTYAPLAPLLTSTTLPIIGATVEGKHHLHATDLPGAGLLVIGHESHGISAAIRPLLTHTVTIQRHGPDANSLNVAVATAIICERWSHA